jgi:hypothetical protein
MPALHNLAELRRIGLAANRRRLHIEQVSHDCDLGEDAVQRLQRPQSIDGQRDTALRFADTNVQSLLNAPLLFVFVARGLTNKNLRQAYAVMLGRRPADLTPRRMSYGLRRLRLHGLIRRQPKTHRYHVEAPQALDDREYMLDPRANLGIRAVDQTFELFGRTA